VGEVAATLACAAPRQGRLAADLHRCDSLCQSSAHRHDTSQSSLWTGVWTSAQMLWNSSVIICDVWDPRPLPQRAKPVDWKIRREVSSMRDWLVLRRLACVFTSRGAPDGPSGSAKAACQTGPRPAGRAW
jgi:hypothetical protein